MVDAAPVRLGVLCCGRRDLGPEKSESRRPSFFALSLCVSLRRCMCLPQAEPLTNRWQFSSMNLWLRRCVVRARMPCAATPPCSTGGTPRGAYRRVNRRNKRTFRGCSERATTTQRDNSEAIHAPFSQRLEPRVSHRANLYELDPQRRPVTLEHGPRHLAALLAQHRQLDPLGHPAARAVAVPMVMSMCPR